MRSYAVRASSAWCAGVGARWLVLPRCQPHRSRATADYPFPSKKGRSTKVAPPARRCHIAECYTTSLTPCWSCVTLGTGQQPLAASIKYHNEHAHTSRQLQAQSLVLRRQLGASHPPGQDRPAREERLQPRLRHPPARTA